MSHIYLLFLIVSLMLSFLITGVVAFLYQKYKINWVKYYIYNVMASIVLICASALHLYLYLNLGAFENSIRLLFGYIANTLFFYSPAVYTLPLFSRELAGKASSRRGRLLFLGLAVALALIGSLAFFYGYRSRLATMQEIAQEQIWLFLITWLGIMIIFVTQFYSMAVVLANYRKIDDVYRKKAALFVIFLNAVSALLVYFDWRAQKYQFENHLYPVGIYLQPLLLLTSTAFVVLYLLQIRKIRLVKSSLISQPFVLKYKITEREAEIVAMIMQGLSNKEIASKLFLSPSTVRNHISNIFEKTAMPTRGKLLNLVKTMMD